MKHKFSAVLLALVAALSLCFGLVACDDAPSGGTTNEGITTGGGGSSESGGGGPTENDDDGLAGKTFVFYDVECEGMDAALLEEYRTNNQNLTYSFAEDGTATSTATMAGMTVETHLTYTVNGNTVTLTTVSATTNGTSIPIPDPAPSATATYNGTFLISESITHDGLTLHIILQEQAE